MAGTIPSIWRPEVLHPLTVHFPVALLLLGALLDLLAAFGGRMRAAFGRTALILLIIGTASAWGAIYTGGIAEDVVNRVICDPTVTNRHEDLARDATWIFSAALLLRLLQLWLSRKTNSRRVRFSVTALQALTTAVFLCGAAVLAFTAHLGATLVYQQGAGTYHPSAACEEFE